MNDIPASPAESVSPERNMVPAETIARLFEYDVRRLGQLAKEGAIPRAERGKYPFAQTVQGLARHLKALAHKKSETYKQKQEEKLDKELRKLDIEIGEMESTLIPIEQMVARLSPGLVAMRQRILSAGLQPIERDSLLADMGKLLEDALTERKSKQ